MANKIVKAIRALPPSAWREQLQRPWESTRQSPLRSSLENPSLVQMLSPHAAKGYTRIKPDSTGRNGKAKDS